MKRILLALSAISLAVGAHAGDMRIDRVCGDDSVVISAEVEANAEGFFVVATSEQITHGDPRILRATDSSYTICTRSVATPGLTETEIILAADRASVSWIFVPDVPSAIDPTG